MTPDNARRAIAILRGEFNRARNRVGDEGRLHSALRDDLLDMVACSAAAEALNEMANPGVAIDPAQQELHIDATTFRVESGRIEGLTRGETPEHADGGFFVHGRDRRASVGPDMAALIARVAANEASITTMADAISALHERIDAGVTSVTTVAFAARELETKIKAHAKHVHERIDGVQTVGTDMATRIAALESEATLNSNSCSNLADRVNVLTTAITNLAAQVQEHDTRFHMFAEAQAAHAGKLEVVAGEVGIVTEQEQPVNTLLECPDAPEAVPSFEPGSVRSFSGPSAAATFDAASLILPIKVPAKNAVSLHLVAVHGPHRLDSYNAQKNEPPHLCVIDLATTHRDMSVTALNASIATVLASNPSVRSLLRL